MAKAWIEGERKVLEKNESVSIRLTQKFQAIILVSSSCIKPEIVNTKVANVASGINDPNEGTKTACCLAQTHVTNKFRRVNSKFWIVEDHRGDNDWAENWQNRYTSINCSLVVLISCIVKILWATTNQWFSCKQERHMVMHGSWCKISGKSGVH